MEILYLLIPLSLALVLAIGVAFWRAVDGGQFDDLDGPALRVVADDDRPFDSDQGAPAQEAAIWTGIHNRTRPP